MYRILYVDDEPSLLDIGKLFLEESGDFTVTTAISAHDGIRLLGEERFDAIVSDYQMPGMDGIQFLIEVRNHFGQVPFILFTGRGREEVVIQAINSGANFYLQKGGEPQSQFAELSHKILTAVEHYRSGEKIQSLNRLYSVLSATNKAIINIRTRNEFFSEICRILVKTGGFRMAWIGLASPEHRIIRPVASAGHIDGYLDSITISTEDVPHGRGPTGTAYRQGKYYVSNDIMGDPRMEPWRENALKRGYMANAAFPFALETKNAGVISLYAPVTGFFDEQVINLLEELAVDVSFALRTIDELNERKLAEEALKESEKKFHTLYLQMTEGAALHQLTYDERGVPVDYVILETNSAFDRLLGISRDMVTGKTSRQAYGVAKPPYLEIYARVALTGEPESFETYFPPLAKHFSISVYSPSKGRFATLFEDITDRKRNEEELLKKNKELAASFEEIAAAEEELRANLEELGRQEHSLRESKKELADIIEFLPDATFAINTSGVVIAWNHAMEVMTDVKKADMLNKGNYGYSLPFYKKRRPILIDLVLGYDENVAEKYQEVRRERDRLIAEIFIPHLHNGRGGYLWFTSSPLYDSQGTITGAIESIREITEHRERESALHQRNEELSAAYEEITATEEELRQQVGEIASGQQALQESKKRYRNIIEDQTEFICRFLPDGTHIFVNDAYCRYFGLARDAITTRRFTPVLHADDRVAVARFFASLTPDKPVGTIDQRILMPDGTTRWQRWNDRALFDEKGTVVEYQSVGRDITDYKRVEEELQKTVREYESLLKNMSDVYYRTNEQGNLILASSSWATLLGYPDLSECIGKNIASAFYADPDVRKLFLEEIYRTGSVTDYEVVLKKRDGSFVTVATSSYLYSDTDGRVLGVEGTFRDITDRKRITDTLREAEQRLTDIINFLPDATFAIDGGGNVIAWNRAIEEMTGVRAGDMIGKGDYEYALPFYGERRPILIDLIFKDDAELKKNYSTVRRDGNILTAETGMAHLGGKNLILWGKASPLCNSRNEVTGAIESIRDFTERRLLEDSLQQLNKKLTLLSSITRHDITNNLTVCRGYMALAKQKSPPAETLNLIAILEKNLGVIQSQLDFTRMYQDLGASAPVWQDIGELLEKCSAAQKIPVISEISRLEVYADPLIGKVFHNLLDNTVRHGEHATGIHARAEERENEMVVVWEDNGVGVLPEEKERIFTRGFGKNTGLGLFLSREILTITGITIRETGEPGKGARFEMAVPKGVYRFTG